VPAPAAGVLADITAKDGETVAVGALLGQIKEGAGAVVTKPAASPTGKPDEKTSTTKPIGAGPEEPQPRLESKPAAVAPRRRFRWRRRCAGLRPRAEWTPRPCRLRQGRARHQGDMMAAIERAAAAPTPVPQTAAAVQVRARRRRTTPRARSA